MCFLIPLASVHTRVVREPHMGILSAKVFTLMITNFARLWHHGQSACILAETTRTRVRQQSSNAWTLQSLWRVSVFTWAALNQPFGRAEIGADVGLQPAHSKPCFMLLAATVSLALSCILTNQSSKKMNWIEDVVDRLFITIHRLVFSSE